MNPTHQANHQKVFCIGFQKTGTTSLGKALEILGYRVCGYAPFHNLREYEGADVWDVVRERARSLSYKYNAFQDTPWSVMYPEMDALHPSSKFLLVTRNTDSWINSVVRDFEAWPNALHQHIYGVPHPTGHEAIWIERYEQHNASVIKYFRGRANFVHLNLNRGEVNWDNLCRFLDCEPPEQDWPYENKGAAKHRKKLMKRVMRRVLPTVVQG